MRDAGETLGPLPGGAVSGWVGERVPRAPCSSHHSVFPPSSIHSVLGWEPQRAPIGQEAACLDSRLPGPLGEKTGLVTSPTSHACPHFTRPTCPNLQEDEPRGWKEMPRWSPATWIHERTLNPAPSISFPCKPANTTAGRTQEAGRVLFCEWSHGLGPCFCRSCPALPDHSITSLKR